MTRPRRPVPPPATGADAAALVGLLAEPDRLRAFAAVVLGSATAEDVAARAGLDPRRAVLALERLAAGGLVETAAGGGLQAAPHRLKDAARHAATARRAGRTDDFGGRPTEEAAVLRSFVVDGRLVRIPAAKGKRRVVLDWLARRFEPGRTYPEAEVNELLAEAHEDVAALRRYLVDEEFLERRDGFYWRAGGTFDV